jgi:hypothetical protein
VESKGHDPVFANGKVAKDSDTTPESEFTEYLAGRNTTGPKSTQKYKVRKAAPSRMMQHPRNVQRLKLVDGKWVPVD